MEEIFKKPLKIAIILKKAGNLEKTVKMASENSRNSKKTGKFCKKPIFF